MKHLLQNNKLIYLVAIKPTSLSWALAGADRTNCEADYPVRFLYFMDKKLKSHLVGR